MVSLTQFRDRLEDRRGKDDKMFRGVWKTVETNAGKIGVAETKGGRSKGGGRKIIGRRRKEEEVEERKDSESKENSRRVGDLG